MTPDAAPSEPIRTPAGPSLFRTTLLTTAGALVVLLMLWAGLRFWLWPDLDRWRPQIESLATLALGRPVQLERISGSWAQAAPRVKIEGLRIDAPDGHPGLTVEAVSGTLSAAALWSGELRFATLTLDAPVVHVQRDAQGGLRVAGWAIQAAGAPRASALDWMLRQERIRIDAGRVAIDDALGRWNGVGDPRWSVALDRQGRRGEGLVQVSQIASGAAELLLRAEWERPLWADPGAMASWTGRAYLAASGGIPQLDGLPARTQAWAVFARGKGPALVVQAAMDEAVAAAAGLEPGQARQGPAQARSQPGRSPAWWVNSRLELSLPEPGQSAWLGRIRHLELRTPAGASSFAAQGSGDLALDFNAGQALPSVSGMVAFEPIELDRLIGAVRRSGFERWLPQGLSQLRWSGRLEGLTLRLRQTHEVADFSLESQLASVGVTLAARPDQRGVASVSGLQGRLTARAGEARLELDSGPVSVHAPDLFADPTLNLSRLQGGLTLRRRPVGPSVAGPGTWVLEAPDLRFADADLVGRANLRWVSRINSPGELELSAGIERIAAARVGRYLPLSIGPATRAWVARAVRGGSVERIEAQVRGDLAEFPFRDPSRGLFRISGRLRDVTLDYAPGWPQLEALEGPLVFERTGFEMNSASARMHGVRLRELQARMPEYREALLSIEAQGAGSAQAMLNFIDESPLASSISTFTRDLRIGADAELDLSLSIPVMRSAQTRVLGQVRLTGNDLQLDRTLPAFEQVSGRIDFTESSLALKGVKARFLGGPLTVEGQTTAPGQMRIAAEGRIEAAAVQALLDNSLTRALTGSLPYEASIDVDRRASTLQLKSDLRGLQSALPSPLTKSADQALALEVRSRPLPAPHPDARPPGDQVDVTLGPDIHLVLERHRDERSDRLRVQRAGFGMGMAPLLRDRGLTVAMRTDQFNFDAWRSLLALSDLDALERSAAESALPGFTLVPDWVSVVADALVIGGTTLNDVVIGASRQAGHWRANIAAREISGHFDWLDARPGEPIGTLRARFDRLSLPRSREGEVEAALARPAEHLPALDVSVEALELGRVPLGRLSLRADNEGSAAQPVWRLRQLEIDNPQVRLRAQGRWAYPAPQAGALVPQQRRTELDLDIDVRDTGGLLERFGVEHAVRSAPGTLSGQLQWQGSPMAVDLPSLQGTMNLALGQGAFLRIDPGAARLVAVLNLQSVSRLLTGDLIEIFREGFAFDEIRGRVNFLEGVIQTTDLRMRGPQATVSLQGSADLKRETQSLQVSLIPELNAGLASIAVGAMVNPAIGLGSLAAQYVLRKPLQAALAMEFDIDGSWTEPRVRERNPRRIQAPVSSPTVPDSERKP